MISLNVESDEQNQLTSKRLIDKEQADSWSGERAGQSKGVERWSKKEKKPHGPQTTMW